MLSGLFFIAFGLVMGALVVYADRSVKKAKRTGVQVTAQVVGEELRVGAKGSRSYYTKVRFPGPNGQWLEHVSIQGHSKPQRRELVEVWYDPADPTDVTVDEPGGRSRNIVGIGARFIFIAIGIYFMIK
jgi:Protein of unknown function (DUF3592)